jgi:DNA-binding NtrC family response regulator
MAYIVLADDEPPLRTALHRTLEDAGHEVADAENGQACEELIERRLPDLVILDMVMPQKEGIEVIADMRGRHPGLKILAISGGGRSASGLDFLTFARRFGANATLEKPFDAATLLTTVKQLLAA